MVENSDFNEDLDAGENECLKISLWTWCLEVAVMRITFLLWSTLQIKMHAFLSKAYFLYNYIVRG